MNETTNSLNNEDINVTTTDFTPVATHDEEQITTNQQFNYDPYTGKPLYKYDPFIGQPLTGNEQSQQFQPTNQNKQISYTTITSDKDWHKAFKLSLWGLGLHHFYVGRVGWGIFGFLKGLLTWMTGIACVLHVILSLVGVTSFDISSLIEYVVRTIIYYFLFNSVSFNTACNKNLQRRIWRTAKKVI